MHLLDPLSLSLRVALSATALTALLAVPLAYVLARRQFAGKSVLEALILMPLVLPPTVVGYLLIVIFGRYGWLGIWLKKGFDYSLLFRVEGAVLAAAVVAFPLLYLPAKAAFATIEREVEEIARIEGAGPLQIFWLVSLPIAQRGILSGVLLAFARALGEFGATVMVLGWQPDRVTLPISIYASYEHGELSTATGAVIALSVISLALVVAYNATLTRK